MSITFLAASWCLLMSTQVDGIYSANITVSETEQENANCEGINTTMVHNSYNPNENSTFTEKSLSETLTANTTDWEAKQGNEGNITVIPNFFNPDENITFHGNSSLLIHEGYSSNHSKVRFRSKRRKRKYMISEFKASWLKAMQFCRSRDMQLVTINHGKDQKILDRLLKENKQKTAVWTSGSNNGGEEKFYWISTGGEVEYNRHWRRGQPDGKDRGSHLGTDHCLQVSPEDYHQWSDFTCFTKQHFICEKDI